MRTKSYVGMILVPVSIQATSLSSARKLTTDISKNLGWRIYSGGETAESGRNKTISVKSKRT